MRLYFFVHSATVLYARMTQPESTPSIDARPLPPRRRDRAWMRRVLLFVACVVALDALVGERSVLQTLRAEREQQRVSGELTDLRRENLELSRRIQRLRNDSGAIEAMARDELGLIRRGEILVVLTNAPRR